MLSMSPPALCAGTARRSSRPPASWRSCSGAGIDRAGDQPAPIHSSSGDGGGVAPRMLGEAVRHVDRAAGPRRLATPTLPLPVADEAVEAEQKVERVCLSRHGRPARGTGQEQADRRGESSIAVASGSGRSGSTVGIGVSERVVDAVAKQRLTPGSARSSIAYFYRYPRLVGAGGASGAAGTIAGCGRAKRRTNSRAVAATSRQPLSIVSACPRLGILTISVTLSLCFWRL